MARAVVTGATGFIGQHLVERLLKQGDSVECVVRATSDTRRLEPLGVGLRVADLANPESLRSAVGGADVVYHLAGLTKSIQGRQLWRVNEEGSRAVAEACAAAPDPPTLVYVSSLAAAGPSPPGRPRVESDTVAPVSDYGRSKRAGEIAVADFSDRLPVTIVRPPIVLGEGDRDGLEMFRGIARWNVHLVPGLADHLFSAIHAADLAEAIAVAAVRGRRLDPDAGDEQGVYFAAADEVVTYRELGVMVGVALGRPAPRIVKSPPAAVWLIAAINEAVSRIRRKPHILNLDKAREATAGGWACSSQILTRDTGFRPAAPLQERLTATAEWYVAQGLLPRRVARPRAVGDRV